MARGEYIKVYLDKDEIAAMNLWQLKQAREGDNQSRSHALKTAFKALMIEAGIMAVQTVNGLPRLRLVDEVAQRQLRDVSNQELQTTEAMKDGTYNGTARRKPVRVRRLPGNDSAGAAHADDGGTGEARATGQSGGRRGQRRRRSST